MPEFPQDKIQLAINELTGEAAIINTATRTSWNLDGYVIESASGALLPDSGNTPGVGWDSLADAGRTGWLEVAPTADALSELNLSNSTTLAPGARLDLGFPLDPALGGISDLMFSLNIAGADEGTYRGSVVPLMTGPNLAADFNKDGKVDGDDFLIWQTAFGTHPDNEQPGRRQRRWRGRRRRFLDLAAGVRHRHRHRSGQRPEPAAGVLPLSRLAANRHPRSENAITKAGYRADPWHRAQREGIFSHHQAIIIATVSHSPSRHSRHCPSSPDP